MTLRAAPDGAALLICASPQNVRSRKVRRRASTRLIRSDRRSARPPRICPHAIPIAIAATARRWRHGFCWCYECALAARPGQGGRPSFGGGARHHHLAVMCGRIIFGSDRPRHLDRGPSARFPRSYNGAPSQEMLVIRRHKTLERTLEPLFRGLICRCQDKKGGALTIQCRSR
jgi:hypothetical protein